MQPPTSSIPVPPAYEPPSSGPYRLRGPRPSPSARLTTFVGSTLGILVFVGFLAFHVAYLIPVPCTSTFGCPTQTPEVVAYVNLVRTISWVAVIVLDLAVGLSVALAFIGGSRNDLPESTRRSMFVFATVFLAAWAIFGAYFFTSILAQFRYL